MNPLRSVRGRLALALLGVVAGALAIVYLIVVPSYERSLVDARLADLRHSVTTIARQPPKQRVLAQQWVDALAEPLRPDRIVVFTYTPFPPLVEPFADSTSGSSKDVQNDDIALRAAEAKSASRFVASGTVTRNGRLYAEVATRLDPTGATVVLLSSPLHNDLETVDVVQRRVLIAGGIALVFALALGYVLASAFAKRIRRLEQAAERIADGRFDEVVVDPAQDELGQLARAFERMRLRLASLERARAEFIANASHELRTPLFSLAGFLELLSDEELEPETRAEFMQEMRAQVSRLTRLATDLLDLSRMDAGRLTIRAERLDLGRVAGDLTTEFRPRAAAADHALEAVDDGPVWASGDGVRVLQIGRILVENALLHTPAGTQVRVEAGLDGSRATLTVSDDGPGVPVEMQRHVFERFFRLEGTVASGSGLGLAIARELAELMGGRIELDSSDGRTSFRLVLQAADARRRPDGSAMSGEARDPAGRGRGTRIRASP